MRKSIFIESNGSYQQTKLALEKLFAFISPCLFKLSVGYMDPGKLGDRL